MALTILQIIQAAIALGAQVYVDYKRNQDGTTTATVTLTQASDKFDADVQQALDWFAAHPGEKPPQVVS